MWYSFDIAKSLRSLNSNEIGLTKKEALKRLDKYGKNELPKAKKESIFKIFVSQIINPIVIVLIVTVIISLILNEVVDAIAIIFIILIDLILGTFQEYKAAKTAEALANLVSPHATVLRNGKEEQIDSKDLVIGDIVLLNSGDKISADLRIIKCENLLVDESILTGESIGIEKNNAKLKEKTPLAERTNMAFAGTSVLRGRAKCLVVATGANTEIGQIAAKVHETKESQSPLTIRINKFSKQISYTIIIISVFLAVVFFIKDYEVASIFSSVIALSVSAMPEGLPLALTMALTVSSNRMAKKNVIVKKLNSVESLGSCTVIASDKTGTLTVNEQTAKKIVLPDNSEVTIEGIGYNTKGKLSNQNDQINELVLLGKINNEASIIKKSKDQQLLGDSIDLAFLFLAEKAKMTNPDIKIIKQIPYESENKYSAVFYEYQEKIHCTIKGSLEEVLKRSKKMQLSNKQVKLDFELINHQNEQLASDGYRNIAVADGVIEKKEIYTIEDINNLVYKGLVGFVDPVREEVKNSIAETKNAGLKVIMITGDHPLTAYAIAKELGICKDFTEVTTGAEIEKIYQDKKVDFDEFVSQKTVFTRVTPTDKLNIVESLKNQDEYVAVTGDGVNDAPALKSANIGVAMGSGTDVAKETAKMIVTDDNFKSIVTGIEEGRVAYSNIRKVIYMLLSCGFAEVLFFLLAVLFDMSMPLVAIQILWLNIVTDGLQDFALSFEKAEDDIMKMPPRNPSESIFEKNLYLEILVSGITIALVVFGAWYYLINVINMPEYSARGYVMALMVFIQNIQVLNCCSEKNSILKRNFRSNPLVIITIVASIALQIIIMEVPALSNLLKTTSIPIPHLLYLFAFSFIILIVMEVYKLILRKKVHKFE